MSKHSKRHILKKISSTKLLEELIKEAVSQGGSGGYEAVDVTGGTVRGKTEYTGPLVTVKGDKKYIGDPKLGLSGQGFWSDFRKRLQAHVNSEYPELGLKIRNLGVTRDLGKAADPGGNTARVAGSKHGSGLAQDVYMDTDTYGPYKSYKTMNPKLASDQKLVDAIISFMEKPEQSDLRWGGAFGSGQSSISTGTSPKGRGILEFHHFEFRGDKIPKFFEKYEDELKKVDYGSDGGDKLKSKDLTTTKNLGTLYKALAEGVITKKMARHILKSLDWDHIQKRLDEEKINSYLSLMNERVSSGGSSRSAEEPGSENTSSQKKDGKKSADGDQISGRSSSGPGQGASSLDAIKNPQTHWNFKLEDGAPSDWDIKNFKPEDIVSKGNGMVVADKKALRALDKCASRASQYKHPPIKLTNQVDKSRNGAYRDPVSNKKQGGASKSRHMYGDGFDLWTKDYNPDERINILKNLSDAGFHAFGHGPNNIHCDMRPGTRVVQWNYSGYKIPNKSLFVAESIDKEQELYNIILEKVSKSGVESQAFRSTGNAQPPPDCKTPQDGIIDGKKFTVGGVTFLSTPSELGATNAVNLYNTIDGAGDKQPEHPKVKDKDAQEQGLEIIKQNIYEPVKPGTGDKYIKRTGTPRESFWSSWFFGAAYGDDPDYKKVWAAGGVGYPARKAFKQREKVFENPDAFKGQTLYLTFHVKEAPCFPGDAIFHWRAEKKGSTFCDIPNGGPSHMKIMGGDGAFYGGNEPHRLGKPGEMKDSTAGSTAGRQEFALDDKNRLAYPNKGDYMAVFKKVTVLGRAGSPEAEGGGEKPDGEEKPET